MKKYIPDQIESRWQKKWEEDQLYKFEPGDDKSKNYYNLVELPYTSGDLHLGHWFAFSPPDAHARYKRMKGLNVLYPVGFDAFGLPAENAAIKRALHPEDWTLSNIETMLKQFKTMGTMIDWEHQLITCLPEYYHWNQWIFLKMFEKGIAYLDKALLNWCPVDQTVLADENIEGGKCWRCGSEVTKKEVEEWFLRLTAYAEQLLWRENPEVDWPKSVKTGQNNWIGRSEGMEISFEIEGFKEKVSVFTVYPETIFGVTYMVLAPEHQLVGKIITKEQRNDVQRYIKDVESKSELERKENKDKTGVFTGAYGINPVNNQKFPIWIADYVIASYGTGAVMGVPASDERDIAFAQSHNLPIIRVIGKDKNDLSEITSPEQVLEEGILVNSDQFSGLKTPTPARAKIMNWLEEKGYGKKKVTYHLRDWSISRQRYWGTPIPIIHCESCGLIPVPYEELPVKLPRDVDFTPKGKPPLASNEEWLQVKCPKCGGQAQRDAQTLDGFFDNSWYFMRYLDPKYDKGPFDPELAKKVTPVDIYFGGAEHTLGHTLYARFFTKFFKELGLVDYNEFALKRVQHGVVLGPDGSRMSKSKGNVVNPDEVIKEYGADTVRVYLAFMMPYIDTTAPWSTTAIAGIYRFLRRIWDLFDKQADIEPSQADLAIMAKTIKKVEEDIEAIHFNTAIAALMEWLNYLSRKDKISKQEYKTLMLLLSPFAPHITEELWHLTGNEDSIHLQVWPKYELDSLKEERINIVIQINGKVRDILSVDQETASDKGKIEELALESDKIKKYLVEKPHSKIIYIPNKLLSIVT